MTRWNAFTGTSIRDCLDSIYTSFSENCNIEKKPYD